MAKGDGASSEMNLLKPMILDELEELLAPLSEGC